MSGAIWILTGLSIVLAPAVIAYSRHGSPLLEALVRFMSGLTIEQYQALWVSRMLAGGMMVWGWLSAFKLGAWVR
jgi:hypothetical protein